jgi:hypothetical protein
MKENNEADWRDVFYEKTFERELAGLEKRAEREASSAICDIEAVLKHLYIAQGQDWLGRGEAGDIEMSAVIAAHEQFLAIREANNGVEG